MSVLCDCGLPAGVYVVKKQGKNLGRKFYGCTTTPKVCEFFKWVAKEQDNEPMTQVVPDPIVHSPVVTRNERPRKMLKVMLVDQGITLEVPEERFLKVLFQ